MNKMGILAVALSVGLSARAFAAEKKAPAQADAAMMQAMKYGTPGEGHKMLEPFVGKWTHTLKMWMKPGDKPQESSGTSENSWVLGGRQLRQEAKGDWMGQPFEGLGYTGYDNIRGEYESIWMDNMSTGMMKSAGTYDPATKTIKQSGTFSCPMTGEKDRWYRSEWKSIGPDKYVYAGFDKDASGKEFKSMEITYTRAK